MDLATEAVHNKAALGTGRVKISRGTKCHCSLLSFNGIECLSAVNGANGSKTILYNAA